MPRWLSGTAFVLLASLAAGCAAPGNPDAIQPNDNQKAAGTLKNGVLTVALETRTGSWQPEGKRSRALDSVVVAPGATTDFAFTASSPGTFYYYARNGLDPFALRLGEDTQLNGAIVVDGPNDPPDRILAISWYFTVNLDSPTGLGRGTMAISGLSWPHTERLGYAQGDSIHWRVLNFTESDHPMHLHGFYFRMDAKGNGIADTLYSKDAQRMAVTEVIPPFQTMSLAWQADRPHQMFGLVMGLTVAPNGIAAAPPQPARTIRMVQREKPNVYGTQPGMSFVMDGTPDAANAGAMPVPGPALFLERGKRVQVTIVNQSDDHAAVHWHRIELESYPDGGPVPSCTTPISARPSRWARGSMAPSSC